MGPFGGDDNDGQDELQLTTAQKQDPETIARQRHLWEQANRYAALHPFGSEYSATLPGMGSLSKKAQSYLTSNILGSADDGDYTMADYTRPATVPVNKPVKDWRFETQTPWTPPSTPAPPDPTTYGPPGTPPPDGTTNDPTMPPTQTTTSAPPPDGDQNQPPPVVDPTTYTPVGTTTTAPPPAASTPPYVPPGTPPYTSAPPPDGDQNQPPPNVDTATNPNIPPPMFTPTPTPTTPYTPPPPPPDGDQNQPPPYVPPASTTPPYVPPVTPPYTPPAPPPAPYTPPPPPASTTPPYTPPPSYTRPPPPPPDGDENMEMESYGDIFGGGAPTPFSLFKQHQPGLVGYNEGPPAIQQQMMPIGAQPPSVPPPVQQPGMSATLTSKDVGTSPTVGIGEMQVGGMATRNMLEQSGPEADAYTMAAAQSRGENAPSIDDYINVAGQESELADAEADYDKTLAALRSRQAGTGAFGSRGDVEDFGAGSDYLRNVQRIKGAGYDRAAAMMEQDVRRQQDANVRNQGAQMEAQRVGLDATGQFRGQNIAAADQLANIGGMIQGGTFGAAQQLSDMGARQDQIRRTQQAFDYEQWLRGQEGGAESLAFVQSMMPGGAQMQYQRKPSQAAQIAGLLGSAAGAYGQFASDVRIKENVKHVGVENGHNIYEFNYLEQPTRYRGVMAQEVAAIQPDAVKEDNGILSVDYGAIGITLEVV